MHDTDVSITNGAVTLAGTLALPEGPGPFPAVVMIHGTGPLDRDENMKLQRLDVFNTLAAHLGARGIASLRYDKRGCGKSTGGYDDAGQSDLLSDAGACLASLEGDARFPRRFLLGHSEGTLLAARLSLERAVDGIVLLTPFLANLETLLRAQAEEGARAIAAMPGLQGHVARLVTRLTGDPRTRQAKLIERIKAAREDSFRAGGQPIPAKSLRELMAIEPADVYRRVRVPTLLLGGAKDLQCAPGDVAAIAEQLGPLATPVLLPDLTHVLRRDPGTHTFLSYPALVKQPLDEEVQRIVADWLAARVP